MFLANGFEEVEALAPVDILRRGNAEVSTVAIGPDRQVTGAHGITVVADLTFDEARSEFSDADFLMLPGGLPGASNLASFTPLCDLLQAHAAADKHIAAICASPGMVLGSLGIVDGKHFTCYPGFEKYAPEGLYDNEKRVVINGNIITGNGPSSAIPFGLAVLAAVTDQANADKVAAAMLVGQK